VIVDIILLILLALAIYKGWTKGFIMAIFVFISYFIALALAFHFSGTVEGYMRKNAANDSQWYSFLSFVLALVAGIVVVRLIGKLIEKSAELMMLGFFNRLFGIFTMSLIYVTFFAVVLVYCQRFGFIKTENASDSKTFNCLIQYGQWLVSHFSEWLPALKNLFNKAGDFIHKSSTV